MSAVAGTAAAQRQATVEAVRGHRFVDVSVAEENTSPQRAAHVSRQIHRVVTSGAFHLRHIVTLRRYGKALQTFPGHSLSRTDVSLTSYSKEFSCT